MLNVTRQLGLAMAMAGLMLGMAGQASAGLVIYTDRADFNAAVSSQSTIDFETPDVGNSYIQYGATTGSTFGSVTFTDPNGRLFLFASSYYGTTGVSQYLNMNDTGSTTVAATFTNPTNYAFGADLGSLYNWGGASSPGNIQITLSTGEVISTTVESDIANTPKSLTFFGLVTDTAFSSVSFYDPSMGLMIDNFAYSSTKPISAVPEPSSIALVCTALPMGLGLAWKRRRKAGSA